MLEVWLSIRSVFLAAIQSQLSHTILSGLLPFTLAPYALRRLYFLDRQFILVRRWAHETTRASNILGHSRVSHRCVYTQFHPIGPATPHHRLRNHHRSQNRLQQSSEQSLLG